MDLKTQISFDLRKYVEWHYNCQIFCTEGTSALFFEVGCFQIDQKLFNKNYETINAN